MVQILVQILVLIWVLIWPDMGADIVGEPWTEYHELDNYGWEELKPFLPEIMGQDRALFSGVLWVFTTRDLEGHA